MAETLHPEQNAAQQEVLNATEAHWRKLADSMKDLLKLEPQEREVLMTILSTDTSKLYQGPLSKALGEQPQTIPEILGIDPKGLMFSADAVKKLVDVVRANSGDEGRRNQREQLTNLVLGLGTIAKKK